MRMQIGARRLAASLMGGVVLAGVLVSSGPVGAQGSQGNSGGNPPAPGSARIDPAPIVTINTQAQLNGKTGIEITDPTQGPTLYPADPGDWLQVLVLKRKDLSVVSNTNVPCPAAAAGTDSAGAACGSQVRDLLKPYDDTDLVIAASPQMASSATGNGQPIGPLGAYSALGSIGVHPWTFWNSQGAQIRQGNFSAIGVPGSATNAESIAQSPLSTTGASIDGSLVRNNDGLYGFMSGTSFSFETQTTASNATQSVMSVGSQSYPVTIPGGTNGGFQVTIVSQRYADGQTQPTVSTQWFSTGAADVPTAYDQLLRMNTFLASADQSDNRGIVLISSRGNPAVPLPPIPQQYRYANQVFQARSDVATKIAGLGGLLGTITDLLAGKSSGASYTLVGQVGLGAAHGYQEVGTVTTAGLNSAPAAGTLTRDGLFYGLAIGQDGPLADAGNQSQLLLHTVFGPTTSWPDQGNAGRTAAIGWIGKQVFGTGDPRTQYWTIPYSVDTWDAKRRDIQALKYPGILGFSKDDFTWAQGELVQEIGWLEVAHGYLASMAEPFDKSALSSWADLQAVAQAVNDKVQADSSSTTSANVGAVFKFLLEVAKELPEPAGQVAGVVGAIYNLAADLTDINAGGGSENADADFRASVAQVGQQLASRLEASETTLKTQFADIIASDYGKLKTVGECADGKPDCPVDPGAWQYTQDDQREASKTLEYAAQSTFYQALMGTKYSAYNLPQNNVLNATTAGQFVGHDTIGTMVCIFTNLSPKLQFAYPGKPDVNEDGLIDNHYSVVPLGYTTGSGTWTDPWKIHHPDASLADRMFNPPDKNGNINAGGLGMNKESFFDLLPNRPALDHFPLKDRPTTWEAQGATLCHHDDGD